ncbi:hypothetical protein F5X99DRAFT_426200 [Biscogniauxia marginata]|nr:hypothetical protein F5X99DRAFT_426200 [Biscogniauxia marginata]
MTAHLRTEAYLREGLYAESWPLYLGYYSLAPAPGDDRKVVRIPSGDGRVCWTAIADLGLASALVLAAEPGNGDGDEYAGRTFYLSTRPGAARTVAEVAALVGRARGEEVRVEVGPRDEVERYYVRERGMAEPYVRWWSSTYEALRDGEALVDDPTLERLLASVGVTPTGIEGIVERMVKG